MQNQTKNRIARSWASIKKLMSLTFLLIGLLKTVHAQDPPQYGTPFGDVPDPRDVNMYQVHLRPFSQAGNFAGVTARLDAIKALGVNVIYLMPHYPHGTDSKSSNSPYCIKDFKGVAAEYGTLTDLRSLVDGAHSRGMAVILDFVVNQTSWDHAWITQHPDWYERDASGNIIALFPDVAKLNFANTSMRAAIVDAMRYWIFAANIDGYRCDYANNAPLDFWTNTIANLRGITSHKLLMFAEGDRPQNFQTGFDMNFGDKWYYDAIKPIANGTSVAQIQTTTDIEYQYANASQQLVRYTSNHDSENVETAIGVFKSHDGVIANLIVSGYMRGVPFITSGQEADFNQTIPWPYTSVKINWSNTAASADFTKVLSFRNNSNAIRRGTMTNYSDNNVCAFTKISGTEKVVVIVNLRNAASNYVVPAALAGSYTNAYTGEAVTLTSGSSLSLTNFQYRVLTNANVPPVAVTGVTVSPTSTSIAAGTTLQLTPTISPSNATNQNVSWSSSNSSVATVNAAGLVTAVAAGSASVTVTTQDGNKTASSAITVTPATTFTVNFFKPTAWGTSVRIYWWAAQPSGVLADGTWPGVLMTNSGNGWYSHTFTNVSSTNLIFNDGTNQSPDLTRNKTGWYVNGTWYDTQPIAVTGVTVSPTATSVNVGATTQLTATVSPANATNKNVSWTSSNTGVASVNSSGLVSGVSSGSATITVTTQDGTKTATSTITVNAVGQTPYPSGTAWAIPGTIEVENFDNGGEGVAFHDNDVANNGGQGRSGGVDMETCSDGGIDVGWTNAGEWLEYTVNVATTGNYDFSVRAASGGSGGTLRIEFNGVNKTGTITIPGTSGWQNWQSIARTGINLSSGTQVMRIYMESGGFNLNKVMLTASGTSTTTYYQIVNRWQSTSYLYDSGNGQVKYSTNPSGNAYQWTRVDVGSGFYILKNRATGNIMHVENQNGSVQCTAADAGWWSAHWSVPSIGDGWFNIVNRWQTGERVHLENLLGYAQYAGAQNDWFSAMWQFVNPQTVSQSEETEMIIREDISERLDVYPNPVVGNQIQIEVMDLRDGENADLSIVNLQGKMVQCEKVGRSTTINHELASGMYLLKVITPRGNGVRKLIVR
jgi:uncharacterized protein YjdB/glycosidase